MGSQQQETKDFFDSYSKEWKESAYLSDGVIQQRNNFSIDIAKKYLKGKLDLYMDAGCGTGDLVEQMSKLCLKLIGIDFAESMIEECLILKEKQNLYNCEFLVADSLTYGEQEAFDMISANGFIEYISLSQLKEFTAHCFSLLKPGGIIALGSRNRLFNLVTLNTFTLDEFAVAEIVDSLLQEAVSLASAESFNISEFEQSRSSVDYQNSTYKHPKTGIRVAQRFQYTPLQMSNILSDVGFSTLEIRGCNLHSLPMKSNQRDLVPPKDSVNHIPYCSTFMIAAQKP